MGCGEDFLGEMFGCGLALGFRHFAQQIATDVLRRNEMGDLNNNMGGMGALFPVYDMIYSFLGNTS